MPEATRTDERHAKANALLDQIEREASGRLKVFLGAAPGVGKTYAMLSAARELKRQGLDVVVGLVETHGRAETQALLDGLELLPRRAFAGAERAHDEFDVDAALARKPALVLVDELAHRNVSGSRHERRYQDIEELLDAGIDVYTTVNIQHLESLNDVVQQITGVRVRETVPDAFFDRARDVVLIDLPPRELIERLRQGKVYLPELASSALERFFTASNLTALRELAMQTAADRVDADLREVQAAQGSGPVPVRRRVLAAIDGSDNSEYLVRFARRIAERRQAAWTVVHVDSGRNSGDAEQQARLDAALRLARRLGGETESLRGHDVAGELLGYAGRNSVATIVIGRTRERPWARLLNRTLSQQLLQRGAHFELTIVATPMARARARRALLQGANAPLRDYGIALLVSLVALGLAHVADRVLSVSNLSQIFTVAVLIVAVRSRMSVAVFSAIVCFFGYNFFFAPPRYTLAIANGSDALTVVLFLATALICSRLATRLSTQVQMLRDANAHAGTLGRLGRDLAAAADAGQVAAIGVRTLSRSFDAQAAVLTPDTMTGLLVASASAPPSLALSATDRAAADWCLQHDQPAGRYTDTLNASTCWLLPLSGDGSTLGVVALRLPREEAVLSPQRRDLVLAIVQDIAQALARTRLADALENARVQGETERLRAALLSSVSHDLRSPLSAMLGSAESLQRFGTQIPAGERDELLDGIVAEGQRLDRYIQNLLDMTRLGHGTLKLARDWVALEEIIGSCALRLRKVFPDVAVERELPAEPLPLLYVHPALIEQALFNIMENAAKFSPPGAAIRIRVLRDASQLLIDVIDRGPGIPENERARIFDLFYSVERGDRGKQGTGLGLSICQGMIGAHGGSVQALPGEGGDDGTVIRVTLPLTAAEPA
ncbi:two-component system sensor histidine kinase KdpD [Tahibacter aquaticus]|uniref:histidine kinase n=1 Tax=Tahibacter aquaticus TaxID=520092 RepID=A0A4R6Z4X7_9GAMM|nr:sensor histidine kinase KdpD [Tahibacter aquaticus]TDR46732.1 two-component system sensor histidine kinase KdpD [Tahibacter aquaticus]